METALYYFADVVPFLWWLVVFFGVWTYRRIRSSGVLLLILGSGLVATIGFLSAFFGPRASLSESGELLSESPGLLPLAAQILFSGIGVVLIVAGVLLLFSRLRGPSAST